MNANKYGSIKDKSYDNTAYVAKNLYPILLCSEEVYRAGGVSIVKAPYGSINSAKYCGLSNFAVISRLMA